MTSQPLADFLRDAWGALVGLEEAASALEGESEALRDALTRVGHRLRGAATRSEFPRLAELGLSVERFGKSFPPKDHPSFEDASQLIGETLNVLPMVFDNVASLGNEQIPQLEALQWRFDSEVPAAEALMAERVAAETPGEIDRALEAFRRQDPEALSFFGPEAAEHIQSLRASLVQLEKTPANADVLKDMFRHAHTIKGAAYTVGCDPVGHLTHALEDLLAPIRRDRRRLGPKELELSVLAVDLVDEMLERLGGHQGPPLQSAYEDALERLEDAAQKLAAEPRPQEPYSTEPHPTEPHSTEPHPTESRPAESPTTGSQAAPFAGARGASADAESATAEQTRDEAPATFQPTLRVELARVDRLLDEAGEVVVARRRLERSLDTLGGLREHLLTVRRRLLESGETGQLDEMADDLGEIGLDMKRLAADVEAQLGELTKRTRGLRSDIGRLRRIKVGQLFERFAPMVRERALELGKTVRFKTRGQHVELDSEVIERLVEPLTHLVQNALYHGLEQEQERIEAGKSRSGALTLAARSEGRTVKLEVTDDGRGIDLSRVRAKAIEKGFLDSQTPLEDEAALELLFLSGLSTEEEVSTGAGRGVGMDAVRQAITDLGGRLDIETEPAQGSRFTLEVPATLIISEALVVRIGGRRFALPLPAVERLLHIDDTLLVEQEGARFLDDAGEKIELVSAAARLGLRPGPPPTMPGSTGVAIRLSGPRRGLALEVEEVFTTSEVVIKSLGSFLSSSTLVSGAFVDGDGDVVLLLDPQAMVEEHHDRAEAGLESGPEIDHAPRAVLAPPPPSHLSGSAQKGPTLLLADDSLSVRRVLARRLGRAGFRVLTARDGAEALDLLLDKEVDGLITDLEMPHLAGDALIRRLRRRPEWKHLPILVVTGRREEANADSLGADAVLTKPVPDGELETLLESFFARSPKLAEAGS